MTANTRITPPASQPSPGAHPVGPLSYNQEKWSEYAKAHHPEHPILWRQSSDFTGTSIRRIDRKEEWKGEEFGVTKDY